MRRLWGWSLPLAAALTSFFLAIDTAFLASNLVKVADNGWFPLLVAAGGGLLMTTWRTGRRMLVERLREQSDEPRGAEAAGRGGSAGPRVRHRHLHDRPSRPDPGALRRLLRMFNALHEHVVFLTALAERVPRVGGQSPGGPGVGAGLLQGDRALWLSRAAERPPGGESVSGAGTSERSTRTSSSTSSAPKRSSPRRAPEGRCGGRSCFAFMVMNAARATEFYRIPPAQVLEVGGQIELGARARIRHSGGIRRRRSRSRVGARLSGS